MSLSKPLIEVSERGLYCNAGNFYIDPWRPVSRAVITHAHADHARRGSESYLTTPQGFHVLKTRMLANAKIETLKYGETLAFDGVHVSLHPAGHVLGSAQVRVEFKGEVWVISGDFKTQLDQTCEKFEPLACNVFVSECTFGLPIYEWEDEASIFKQVNAWWAENAENGRTSVVFAYSLGKAQRLIAGVDPSIGPIYCHGAVEQVNHDYRATGVPLPKTEKVTESHSKNDFRKALIVAPPSANGSTWMKRFPNPSRAFASGWMTVRGARRRRAVDRGFVLSDHADWQGLVTAISATNAERVLLTHGNSDVMIRWLQEMKGIDAYRLATPFSDNQEDGESDQLQNEPEPKLPVP